MKELERETRNISLLRKNKSRDPLNSQRELSNYQTKNWKKKRKLRKLKLRITLLKTKKVSKSKLSN